MKKTVETKEALDDYKCFHCERTFVRPTTLQKHLCEEKRRWDSRDRPANRIAFNAWLKFYQQFQPSRKKREYKDFTKSPYYGAFVKFGTYCVDVNVVNPLSYAEWLLKDNAVVDTWNSDSLYTRYLIEYLRMEDPMDAVERSVKNMLTLAESESINLGDVFRYVNANKLCQYFVNGKISAWILYHCDSGIDLLGRLDDGQRGLIYDYIDPEKWQIKFKRHPEVITQVKTVVKGIQGL